MDMLEQLLSDLVAIDSVNPDLVPGGAGEAAIAGYIADWMEKAGLEVHVDEPAPNRPNVIGIVRGTGGGRTLMLNGHMDTVGVTGMQEPHRPRIADGRLYGRGAYDMKGGLAAALVAAAMARTECLRGDLIVTAVMDEEYAGVGTIDLAKRYRADGAIVAEPTHLELIVAHKGFVWLEVETQGKAAHGSRPDLGIDAITGMGHVLVEVEALERQLRSGPTHPLLGTGSVHAGLIRGGQEMSSYPERCVVTIERRTLPGETPEGAEAELAGIVRRLEEADPAFRAVVRRGIDRPPLETPEDAAIVDTVGQAVLDCGHAAPKVAGVGYWTDAATLWAAGIPAVLYGPTGAGAHATEEWVDLESVRQCAEVYLATARAFCS